MLEHHTNTDTHTHTHTQSSYFKVKECFVHYVFGKKYQITVQGKLDVMDKEA